MCVVLQYRGSGVQDKLRNPVMKISSSTISAAYTTCCSYLELTKPRVTLMVLITTGVGFYLGSNGAADSLLLLHTLVGTALVAAGTSSLNQYLERDVDARMHRTRSRPLPTGRLKPQQALVFAVSIAVMGLAYLVFTVNLPTATLAGVTLATYVFLYTPLKQKTALSTLVGAVPGALPPMGGWVAARNELSIEAWVLFAILFWWQLPHVLAISWLYVEDYKRAGFPLLPVFDRAGFCTSRQITSNCLALLPVSLLPTLVGMAGPFYFVCALALGLIFLSYGVAVLLERTNASLRRLVSASLVYLPALLALMAFDKATL